MVPAQILGLSSASLLFYSTAKMLQMWFGLYARPSPSAKGWPVFADHLCLWRPVAVHRKWLFPEIRQRKPGMMTLISLAIAVSSIHSVAALSSRTMWAFSMGTGDDIDRYYCFWVTGWKCVVCARHRETLTHSQTDARYGRACSVRRQRLKNVSPLNCAGQRSAAYCAWRKLKAAGWGGVRTLGGQRAIDYR